MSREDAEALEAAGDRLGAAKAWRALARRRPDDPAPRARLGALLHDAAHFQRAFACFREAVDRGDDSEDTLLRAGHCLMSLGRADEALAYYRQLLDREPTPARISAYLFALLLAPGVAPAETAAEHKRLAASLGEGPPRPARRPPRDALRVGLISGDLGGLHPVAQILEPALVRLAGRGARFVVYALRDRGPDNAARIESYAERRFVRETPDAGLARLIRGDDLDLLVDLAGHTSGNRLAVLAQRPAPRQAAFLGYPFSTGAPFFDAIIADPVVCPEGAETLYGERSIVRLPRAFAGFEPPEDMPDDRAKSERDAIVFGSLNNAAKLNPPTIALWTRVLAAVPESRLLLKSKAFVEEETRESLKSRFEAAGIAPGRVTIEPRSPFPEAMARYRDIDIALDPVRYNGGMTTAQALWMGTPVVTLPGQLFCARMGASLLTAAGQPQWIAEDLDDYVRIAAGLAADPAALRDTQAGLVRSLPGSPLCDAEGYAESLLAAFRAAAALPAE